MTDRYTDELFALPASAATMLRFPVSRLVVDPERFVDDADEPMAACGMGVIYTRASDGRRLRADPTPAERASLLARFYEPHHKALTDAVATLLDARGACLVIDGHSFPSRPLPYEPDQREDRPDICIGTDAFHTPTWLRDAAVTEFERAGFEVAIDRPFAGALVPVKFYGRDPRVMAFMVEINRGLYMDEDSGVKLDEFGELQRRIGSVLNRIVRAWQVGA
jgi:N-formylglutamate amidohydrolase